MHRVPSPPDGCRSAPSLEESDSPPIDSPPIDSPPIPLQPAWIVVAAASPPLYLHELLCMSDPFPPRDQAKEGRRVPDVAADVQRLLWTAHGCDRRVTSPPYAAKSNHVRRGGTLPGDLLRSYAAAIRRLRLHMALADIRSGSFAPPLLLRAKPVIVKVRTCQTDTMPVRAAVSRAAGSRAEADMEAPG